MDTNKVDLRDFSLIVTDIDGTISGQGYIIHPFTKATLFRLREAGFPFTLATGKKIQVPFEQLIIFSTNLEPSDLVDEAFLRRIPYKIEIGDASEEEFHRLFQIYCRSFGCEYRKEVVDYLLQEHYRPQSRPLRRCQPRDLLSQIDNYCRYNDLPVEMRPEYFDRMVRSYFTVVIAKS